MYWSQTWLPSAIEEYISMRWVDIEKLIEEVYSDNLYVSEVDLNLENLKTITAEVLFLTSGYLTVKEASIWRFLCEFPNKQVEMVVTDYFVKLMYGVRWWMDLLKIWRVFIEWLKELDKNKIKESIERVLEYVRNVSYEWIVRNPEWWLKTAIVMMLNLNLDILVTEKHFISWRSDIWIKCCGKRYVIEVKVDWMKKELLKQMKDYENEADVVIGINWKRKKNIVEVM